MWVLEEVTGKWKYRLMEKGKQVEIKKNLMFPNHLVCARLYTKYIISLNKTRFFGRTIFVISF